MTKSNKHQCPLQQTRLILGFTVTVLWTLKISCFLCSLLFIVYSLTHWCFCLSFFFSVLSSLLALSDLIHLSARNIQSHWLINKTNTHTERSVLRFALSVAKHRGYIHTPGTSYKCTISSKILTVENNFYICSVIECVLK